MDDFTELIHRVNEGEPGSREALFAAAYGELRELARSRLRQGGRGTFIQTTSLVHESFLRFICGGQLRSQDRRAFFAYASFVMRSVIVDTVRERQSQRRGGNVEHLSLNTDCGDELPSGEDELLRVHEALLALEDVEPRLARIVELRYFGGYDEAEISEILLISGRQVRREWSKARMMLMTMLKS